MKGSKMANRFRNMLSRLTKTRRGNEYHLWIDNGNLYTTKTRKK